MAKLTICLINPDRSHQLKIKASTSRPWLLILDGMVALWHKIIKPRPWMPPGWLLEVAGMTNRRHKIIVWDELTQQGRLTEETLPQADIYGIGGLSTSRKRAYQLSRMVHNSGKKVVAGGIDVTGHFLEGNRTELLDNFDSIVVGRLTKALWHQVITDLSNGIIQKVYQAAHDEPWEFILPSHHLINPKLYVFPSIRTSAGCSQSCPFCTVHLVTGGRRIVHCKSRTLLKKELELLPKTRFPILICDDSFGADQNHALKISLPLLKAIGRPWVTEITLLALCGEDGLSGLLEPMMDSGCVGVYVGIENLDKPVSTKSLSRDKTEKAIKRIHNAGLLILGSFILDINGKETPESIRETIKWMVMQLDFVQLSLLALLPGSALRRNAQRAGKVIDDNPDHLDGAWPTIAHPISPEQRIQLLHEGYSEFYSYPNIARRLWRARGNRPHFAMTLVGNLQIHRSVANWASQDYQHWFATRQLPPT